MKAAAMNYFSIPIHLSILFALVFASNFASAETYKCSVNGKNVYSDRPCGSNQSVLIISDNPVDEDSLKAANQRLNVIRAQQGAGDDVRREAGERAEQRRQDATQSTAAPRPTKQDYCNGLLRKAKDAKDESNKWRYHQGLIDDAKRRQKEAEDEHFSNCYGQNF